MRVRVPPPSPPAASVGNATAPEIGVRITYVAADVDTPSLLAVATRLTWQAPAANATVRQQAGAVNATVGANLKKTL